MIPIGRKIGFALFPVCSIHQPAGSYQKLTIAKDPSTVFDVFVKTSVATRSDV